MTSSKKHKEMEENALEISFNESTTMQCVRSWTHPNAGVDREEEQNRRAERSDEEFANDNSALFEPRPQRYGNEIDTHTHN